jgi:hypothetical protein
MVGAAVLSCAAGWAASAQAPAQGPAFAIYCRGPLVTTRTDGGKTIKTPFKWAKEAATKANPGAGECARPESAPQAPDKAGDAGTIVGNLGPFDNLPVATVGKLCVSRSGSDFQVREILRQLGHQTAPYHIPPFSDGGCTS